MLFAGAFAFYLLVSLVPLLLVVTAILSQVIHSSDTIYSAISSFFGQVMPATSGSMLSIIEKLAMKRFSFGIIGGIFLIWTAGFCLDVAIQMIDRVWGVEERWSFGKRKLLSFLMIPFMIIASFISFGFSTFISFMRNLNLSFLGRPLSTFSFFWQGIGILASLITVIGFLYIFFKLVPHIYVTKKAAFIGALFSGVAWELARNLFDWYIVRFTGFNKIYGNIASVFIGLLWVYYTAIIILLGAEIAGYFDEKKRICLQSN
jgi:membrane protein